MVRAGRRVAGTTGTAATAAAAERTIRRAEVSASNFGISWSAMFCRLSATLPTFDGLVT